MVKLIANALELAAVVALAVAGFMFSTIAGLVVCSAAAFAYAYALEKVGRKST